MTELINAQMRHQLNNLLINGGLLWLGYSQNWDNMLYSPRDTPMQSGFKTAFLMTVLDYVRPVISPFVSAVIPF